MIAVHPGRVLKREMTARDLSANRLALALRVPSNRVTGILAEQRGITPDTALRLSQYFGNSARFWLNLQTAYDLAETVRQEGARIEREVIPGEAA